MTNQHKTFEIKDTFYLDGKPIKLISGSIHYFRIVPEYWRDRLLKLKAMGCNAVESYVPWNLCNPRNGVFDFSGMLNLRRFVEIAEELGLYFILRPGPYICAEWEFGGHPGWLLKDPYMEFRSTYKGYIDACREYLCEMAKQIVDKQITRGGNIIMIQIENEYGYYGNDKTYLNTLKVILQENEIEVPFFTSDGPWDNAYLKGSLANDEVLPTFNFGSNALQHYENIKIDLGNRPFMCMEFWIGWFDYWGGKHANRSAESVKKDLDDLLSVGHVNFFMFSGGTNFGFTNGANDSIHNAKHKQRVLQPDVTSYDYDGILTEAGDLTPKYFACKEVISKYHEIPDIAVENTKKHAYGVVKVDNRVGLFNILDDISKKYQMNNPVSMELLDQNYGYILYRTKVHETGIVRIDLVGASDRVHYFVDEKLNEIRYDSTISQLKNIIIEKPETTLDFLVENMGRVNFGHFMSSQQKGIRGPILLNGEAHYGYDVYPLGMDKLEKLDFSREYVSGLPSFSRFYLEVCECNDTFLKLDGFTKGFVVINGFNLGRYYNIGPQQTLYVPGPVLKLGTNEIIVFESDGNVCDTIEFVEKHVLG